MEFFINAVLLAALWPCGRLSLNWQEYQEYFFGGKGGRLTTLPLTRADCHVIWEPQPTGTLRACPSL